MEQININHPKAFINAIKILNKGGVIVYPTDTLYGFGVDATSEFAVNKLNKIKGRADPLSVMAPNTETALSWMDISTNQFDMMPFYLGGAKTLIVPVKKNIVCTKVLGEHSTLGIRIPNNDFCNNLSTKFVKPITSTSVNRTNEKPLNDPEQILNEFGNEIDLIIDGGTLPQSNGSTIYQLKNEKIIILRN